MQPTTDELLALGDRLNSPSYAPARLIFERGEGTRLYDRDGGEYLDFVAGIAVNALGYGHPRLTKAIQEQAETLLHVSNMYYTEPQIRLMEALVGRSFADRVFLCNSGTESTEAAMKLARRYQKVVAGRADKSEIVSMEASFHGRTLASITATGQPKYHKGFEPLVPGHGYARFNDVESTCSRIDGRTAAVILEPVQGEGGIRPAEQRFLEAVRERCDEVGALLIFDEVQTGVGRTGTLFAYEGYGVIPDIICLAKGLGGGVPIGAMMATEEVFEGWERGSHASTFGGNPLASRAALAVLEAIEDEALCQNARERGEQLKGGLAELAGRYGAITEIRGRGLMVGAQCTGDVAGEVVGLARDEGLLINTAGGNTLRFVPPLTVTAADVDEALERLERAFASWSSRAGQ